MTAGNWVTLVAALVAAAAALTNVIMTGRRTRRIELEKWRRQEESAAAARVMVSVRELDELWLKLANTVDRGPEDPTQARVAVVEQDRMLRLAVAELDLIASKKTVARTQTLINAIEGVTHALRLGGSDDKMVQYFMAVGPVRPALSSLTDEVRADLGLDRLKLPPED